MKYIKLVKYIDTFGTPYIQNFTPNDKYKKSILGGFVSIIVYSLSLAYLIYVLNQWISGNILPKTTIIQTAQNYTEFHFQGNEQLLDFSYWKYDQSFIDPFRLQSNILMPIAIKFVNGVPTKPMSLLSQYFVNEFGIQTISMKDITLIQNANFNAEENFTTEVLVMIVLCNKDLLEADQSCAEDSEIDKFFNQGVNYITFWLHFKQFDPLKQEVKSIRKQVYFPFDRFSQVQAQIMFQQTKAIIDQNILFESNQEIKYIDDGEVIMTTQKLEFWRKMFNFDCFISVYLRLDPLLTEFHVSYPKIGEVLASVGSIASILLSVRILMEYYNRNLLDKSQIKDVLAIYFPQFYNWSKQEKAVFIKQNQRIAQQKLLLQNIIYEISRLQFFVQINFGRALLQDTLNMGLQTTTPNSRNNDQLELNIRTAASLQKEDFRLLTFPQFTTSDLNSRIYVSNKLIVSSI